MSGDSSAEDVACVVDVDVGEAEGVEAVEEPGGSGGFAEGWGGDADEVELPAAELRLVEMQPVEGAVDCGERGEAGDAMVGGGGHVCVRSQCRCSFRAGISTRPRLRKRPRAGAVGPAAVRSRATRM